MPACASIIRGRSTVNLAHVPSTLLSLASMEQRNVMSWIYIRTRHYKYD